MDTNKKLYYLHNRSIPITIIDEDAHFVLGYMDDMNFPERTPIYNVFCKTCAYAFVGWSVTERHDFSARYNELCSNLVPSKYLLAKGRLLFTRRAS